MAIFGFIVLVLIGVVLLIQGVLFGIVDAGLTGKTTPVPYIMIFISGLLFWIAYDSSPFTIILK